MFPAQWIDEFTESYPRRIGLPFDILMNPSFYSSGVLAKLKKAGLVAMQVGIQGGSRREIEESYARKDVGEKIFEMARQARALGITVFYDVIMDNPLATGEDKKALVDYLLALPRPFHLFVYSLTIFPKSQIARKLLDAGLITEDEIEGRATKSFRQFRLSLDYPRPAEDTYWASLAFLTSKRFVPRRLTRWLARRKWLRRHPAPLRWFAEFAGIVKMIHVGISMWRRGELSGFKLREYATMRRRLSL